jgi:hypothetical protein
MKRQNVSHFSAKVRLAAKENSSLLRTVLPAAAANRGKDFYLFPKNLVLLSSDTPAQ